MSKKTEGITVYQSDGEGEHRFLGITTIDETALNIFKIAGDVKNNKYWMADCIHSELVEKISENEFIAYYITKPPWPVSKRDSIISVKMVRESDSRLLVRMKALPEGEAEKYIKKRSDYVRIYKMTGSVELNENKGVTEVRFSVSGGPGGRVPDFIVRWGGWRIPYKTLSGLRAYVLGKKPDK
ncbi:MAG TPA: START domain-containing protein [Spirochaetota bacterium]|nr:START domain-containing protein [Spirochaetota bacterium]